MPSGANASHPDGVSSERVSDIQPDAASPPQNAKAMSTTRAASFSTAEALTTRLPGFTPM